MSAPTARSPSGRLNLSVLTCAYNEEQNIDHFLASVLGESDPSLPNVYEVWVVASGCTDRTVPLVKAHAARDPRVKLVEQPERAGKAAALALGLERVKGDIVLIQNADTTSARGTIERVLGAFQEPGVSLVCTHPVPVADVPGPVSHLGQVLWALHDRVSRQVPKSGEAFAFRRMKITLPADVEDDDTYIGRAVQRHGGRSIYLPDAVVYNRAPSNLRDLLHQRYRINRQVVGFKRRYGESGLAWSPRLLGRAIASYVRDHPREVLSVALLMVVEGSTRFAAMVVYRMAPRSLHVWAPISSTKSSISGSGPR